MNEMAPAAVLIIMGVSSSGKSTVGRLLAERLGWRFEDADAYHPPTNVAKMIAGTPLTDADRAPWLATLRTLVAASLADTRPLVLACSALKQAYRDQLRMDERVRFVYLYGDEGTLAARAAARRNHFMPPGLLQSQLATLEEPHDALRVDVGQPVEAVVEEVLERLKPLNDN
jgi:carbohydrate kinase (thermoresistant glucokinase family)